MKKYDFQKPSKIPYLETTGMPTRILLKNAVLSAITVQNDGRRNLSRQEKSPNPSYYQPKIAQKLIEKIL